VLYSSHAVGGFGFYKAIIPRVVWLTSMVGVAGFTAEVLEGVVETNRSSKKNCS
jgi:hypothetical protein